MLEQALDDLESWILLQSEYQWVGSCCSTELEMKEILEQTLV
jgi:hypothetical protein